MLHAASTHSWHLLFRFFAVGTAMRHTLPFFSPFAAVVRIIRRHRFAVSTFRRTAAFAQATP
ncbi:hypothetical protein QEM13_004341 [Pseudomonas putida]|nr:hypothetical protein [Pseudomonas putida]